MRGRLCVPRLGRRLIGVVGAVVLGTAPALAREYSIPEIDVDVEVMSDGSVQFSEERTYVYDGRFSFANYRLPKKGFTAIRDIRVSEGDRSFTNENTENAGTFLVQESARDVNVRWFYSARSERRTFTVSYTLDGAIVNGPEWSEFFWTYVAAGREKRTDRLRVTIHLPDAVAPESLQVWTRGPEARIDAAAMTGGYVVTAANIGSRELVSIRTVFPTSVFRGPGVGIADPGFSVESARAGEAAFRAAQTARAERNARFAETGGEIALLVVVAALVSFLILFNKYGRRFPVDGAMATHAGLIVPGRIEPAAIGWLLAGRQTTAGHLLATLLDLARRGYFAIDERPPDRGWLPRGKATFSIAATDRQPGHDLLGWERSLLEFVRGRLDGGARDLEELFKHSSRSVAKWFSVWKREVRADGSSRGWVDERSYRGALLNAVIQVSLALVAMLTVAYAGPAALLAMLVCIVLAVLSAAIIRRTREGESVYRRWKLYRGTLTRGEQGLGDEAELGLHFIYAVAFGVRKQGIESLFTAAPNAVNTMTWIVLVNPNRSPADLAQTFATLNATGTAAFGGAAGVAGAGAGGASAGAAGGGASGGAG